MVDFFTLDDNSASSPTLGFDNSLGFVNTYDPNPILIDLPTFARGGLDTDFINDLVTVDTSLDRLIPDWLDIDNFNFTNDIPSLELTLPTQIEPVFDFLTGELTNLSTETTTTPPNFDIFTSRQTFAQLQPPVVEIEPSNSELIQTPPFDELTNNSSTTIESTFSNDLLNNTDPTPEINPPELGVPNPNRNLFVSEASNPLTDKELPC